MKGVAYIGTVAGMQIAFSLRRVGDLIALGILRRDEPFVKLEDLFVDVLLPFEAIAAVNDRLGSLEDRIAGIESSVADARKENVPGRSGSESDAADGEDS